MPWPWGNLHHGAFWAEQPPTCSGRSAFPGTCWLWTSRSLWPACWQIQTLRWWHTDLRSDRRVDWDSCNTSDHLGPWGNTLQLGWDTALCPDMVPYGEVGTHCVFAFLPLFLHIYIPAARIKLYTSKSQVLPAEMPVTRCDEDWSSNQFPVNTMICIWKTQHHPLTCNNKHDARGQSHVGFCRILHAANTNAFQSKNAHKKAKDAQNNTHDHEGPHSLEHCCKAN